MRQKVEGVVEGETVCVTDMEYKCVSYFIVGDPGDGDDAARMIDSRNLVRHTSIAPRTAQIVSAHAAPNLIAAKPSCTEVVRSLDRK